MRHPKKSRAKSKPAAKVAWQMEVTPWAVGIGMLLGFVAEVVWEGNKFWMTGGAFAGGLAGALCDTGILLYRRLKPGTPWPHDSQSQSRHGHN